MITSRRNVYTPSHITPDVKKALLEESQKKGISVSLLMYRLMHDGLKKLKYRLDERL